MVFALAPDLDSRKWYTLSPLEVQQLTDEAKDFARQFSHKAHSALGALPRQLGWVVTHGSKFMAISLVLLAVGWLFPEAAHAQQANVFAPVITVLTAIGNFFVHNLAVLCVVVGLVVRGVMVMFGVPGSLPGFMVAGVIGGVLGLIVQIAVTGFGTITLPGA